MSKSWRKVREFTILNDRVELQLFARVNDLKDAAQIELLATEDEMLESGARLFTLDQSWQLGTNERLLLIVTFVVVIFDIPRHFNLEHLNGRKESGQDREREGIQRFDQKSDCERLDGGDGRQTVE